MYVPLLLTTLSGLASVSGKILTVVDPCPQNTKPHALTTITAQNQVLTTCAATTECSFRKCSTIYAPVPTTWVSSEIPCGYDDRTHSSTLVTKVAQDITCSSDATTLTKATIVPVTIRNRVYQKRVTLQATARKEWIAQYQNLGPIAMPDYSGSGLCSGCIGKDGSFTQDFEVEECRSYGSRPECFRYMEKWVIPAPTTTSARAVCPVRTAVASAGTYTFHFPQTIPATIVTVRGQPTTFTKTVWVAEVTAVCQGPTFLDFTITQTRTVSLAAASIKSVAMETAKPSDWDDWVAPPERFSSSQKAQGTSKVLVRSSTTATLSSSMSFTLSVDPITTLSSTLSSSVPVPSSDLVGSSTVFVSPTLSSSSTVGPIENSKTTSTASSSTVLPIPNPSTSTSTSSSPLAFPTSLTSPFTLKVELLDHRKRSRDIKYIALVDNIFTVTSSVYTQFIYDPLSSFLTTNGQYMAINTAVVDSTIQVFADAPTGTTINGAWLFLGGVASLRHTRGLCINEQNQVYALTSSDCNNPVMLVQDFSPAITTSTTSTSSATIDIRLTSSSALSRFIGGSTTAFDSTKLASMTASSTITTSTIPLPSQTCFEPSLSAPNPAQVTAAVNQWLEDITTVNSFLEIVLGSRVPMLSNQVIEEKARSIYITAFDEPCQLTTLVSAISNAGIQSLASECAFNDLAGHSSNVFGRFVIDQLGYVVQNPTLENLLANATTINQRRCCNVLRDVDTLFSAVGEVYQGTPERAPRPSTCEGIVCGHLSDPAEARCSDLPFVPISSTTSSLPAFATESRSTLLTTKTSSGSLQPVTTPVEISTTTSRL